MKNIVYTNAKNVTVEISWEAYRKEIEMRTAKRISRQSEQTKAK